MVITLEQIKEISERDKWYSLAINPFVWMVAGFVVGIVGFTMPLYGAALGCVMFAFIIFISHMLYWERFGKSWKIMFRCDVDNKKYVVVKDGSRRLRVFWKEKNDSTHEVRDNSLVLDDILIDWLDSAIPIFEKPNFSMIS